MGGITKHGSAKRSIEILERDKEQTLKTLWREEKLDDFFPRQELVDEMHELHEEHREAKRKAREDSDTMMGDAGETARRGGKGVQRGGSDMGKKAGWGGDRQAKENTVCSRVQTHY